MASSFPGAIDSFTDPLSGSPLNSPSHSAQHADLNDAVEKIETYALALPKGVAGRTSATVGTAFVANTALTVLSLSITVNAGRRYQIFGKLAVQYSTSATVGAALYVTANAVDRSLYYQTAAVAAFFNIGINGFTTYTAAEMGVTSGSASRTIDLKFKSGGAGNLNSNPDSYIAANSFSQELVVLDIGLA
jgi:hypothetical protein